LALTSFAFASDIYLAVRTDGNAGSGTAADPFNASTTAQYDALLHQYSTNTTFHYQPGVYQTSGWHFQKAQTAGTNCVHLGAGIDQTIIRLVTADPGGGILFGVDYNVTCSGFELSGLTLDCNANGNPGFAQGSAAYSAVNVNGSNILINNTKIIGFGTAIPGVECFPVFSCPNGVFAGQSFSNVVVQNSIFTAPATGNQDGLSACFLGATQQVNLTGAKILNCSFVDIASDFTYSHAMYAQTCQGNYVKGCQTGWYVEPSVPDLWAMTISNNTFVDVPYVVFITFHPGGKLSSLTFANNHVVLPDAPNIYSTGFSLNGNPTQGPLIGSLNISGNQYTGDNSTAQVHYYRALDLRFPVVSNEVASLVIQNNQFSTSIPSGLEFQVTKSAVSSIQNTNNHYSNGALVPVSYQ